jgi:hypothetical protein
MNSDSIVVVARPTTERYGLDGGLIAVLNTGIDGINTDMVALDDENLYAAVAATTSGPTSIMRSPLDGGAPATVGSSQGLAVCLFVNRRNLYWVAGQNDDTLYTVSLDGPPDGAAQPISNNVAPFACTADGVNIYWIDAVAQVLEQMPLEGGLVLTLGPATSTQAMISDGRNVYWANFQMPGEIYEAPIDGGPYTMIGQNGYGAVSLAVDSKALYVANDPGGVGDTLNRLLLDGGPITTVLKHGHAIQMVADEHFLYWITSEDDGVWRVAKP